MELLKEWVRSLAMLIILATCLELLVPMGGMKKYVRMTMGLLVMLTMINPLFRWLGEPVQLDPALFAPEEGDRRLPTVEEIMVEASRFREKNEAMVLAESRERLQAEAADAARRVEGVASAQAEVELVKQGGRYEIRRVTVAVTPGDGRGGVAAVSPVAPVHPGGGEQTAGSGQAGAREPEGAELALSGQVRQQVAERLGLTGDEAAVHVLIQRQPASQRR